MMKKNYKKLSKALLILIILFSVIGIANSANATTFSKTLNNYTFLDYPVVIQGNEHYEFNANYENGYGVWNVYHDYYWCTLNNGSYYSGWSVFPPDSTKYSEGNSPVYNTEGTRVPYQGSGYYPGDTILFSDIANFSTYTSSGYSLGEAYAMVSFYDLNLGASYSFSLDVGINF